MENYQIGLGLSLLLLIVSAVFSYAETCLTIVNQNKILADKSKKASYVIKLLAHKSRMISTILFANTLINVLLSSIAATIFGGEYVILTPLITTTLILIFAEVLPKTLALFNPEKSSIVIAPFILLSVKIFYPITFVIQAFINSLFVIFGFKKEIEKASLSEDIKDLVSIYRDDNNSLEQQSLKMLNGVSTLHAIHVTQIMVHRLNVSLININDDLQNIISYAVNAQHSRIPICEGDTDNIIGVLHIKDLFRELWAHNNQITKKKFIEICQKPLFIPEHTPLLVQLNNFRKVRKHLGIIVDEYSVFQGIVTIEDIIEEIVGAIYDEYDKEYDKDLIKKTKTGYIVVGSLPLHELIQKLSLSIADHEEYSTIAGLLIEKFGHIPETGEQINIDNYIFTILKTEHNKIISVNIEIKEI